MFGAYDCIDCAYLDINDQKGKDAYYLKKKKYVPMASRECSDFAKKRYVSSYINDEIGEIDDTFPCITKVVNFIRKNNEFSEIADRYDEVGPRIVDEIDISDRKEELIEEINLSLSNIELEIEEAMEIDYMSGLKEGISLYFDYIEKLGHNLLSTQAKYVNQK